MRLSINGWHPIASHLVCIITGIALSNILNRQVRASSPPKGELNFSLNKEQTKTAKSVPSEGGLVNIYKIGQSQVGECRMFKNALSVNQLDGKLYFTTIIDEQVGLQHLTKEMKLRNKVGIDRNQTKVPLCRSKPKVQYGS